MGAGINFLSIFLKKDLHPSMKVIRISLVEMETSPDCRISCSIGIRLNTAFLDERDRIEPFLLVSESE